MSVKWSGILCAVLLGAALWGTELKFNNNDRILIFGASNIWFGSYRPYGHAALFRNGLRAAGCRAEVFSTGHPGEGTVTFRSGRLEKALDWAKPTCLILTAGGNDVMLSQAKAPGYTGPQSFESNLNALIDLAEKRNIRVIAVTGTAGVIDPETIRLEDANAEIVRKIARERKLPLIDLYAAIRNELRKHPEQPLHIDKIHLNGLGYQLFAKLLLEAAGVPAETLREQEKNWQKIPSMTLYLNPPHVPTDLVTPEEYRRFLDAAHSQKLTVEEYVRRVLREHAEELRKN